MHGGTVCYTHGGAAKQVRAKAAKRVVAAKAASELARLGQALVEVDAGEALVHLIWEAAANLEWYRAKLVELDIEYGPTYHATGVPTGEGKPHVLVTMYDAERDRLASYAAAALRAGVDERRVRLVEADAARVFAALVETLAALGINAATQEAVRVGLATRLRAGPRELSR